METAESTNTDATFDYGGTVNKKVKPMNKKEHEPFEIFKEEDSHKAGIYNPDQLVISIGDANAKLNREGQIVYSYGTKTQWSIFEDIAKRDMKKCSDPTLILNKGLLISPRPIEKEEPACDHIIDANIQTTIPGCNQVEGNKYIKILYKQEDCPKCVKDLK